MSSLKPSYSRNPIRKNQSFRNRIPRNHPLGSGSCDPFGESRQTIVTRSLSCLCGLDLNERSVECDHSAIFIVGNPVVVLHPCTPDIPFAVGTNGRLRCEVLRLPIHAWQCCPRRQTKWPRVWLVWDQPWMILDPEPFLFLAVATPCLTLSGHMDSMDGLVDCVLPQHQAWVTSTTSTTLTPKTKQHKTKPNPKIITQSIPTAEAPLLPVPCQYYS